MVMIGDEASGALLRELDLAEVDEISKEIARVHAMTPDEAEGVLERVSPDANGARLRAQGRHRLRP